MADNFGFAMFAYLVATVLTFPFGLLAVIPDFVVANVLISFWYPRAAVGSAIDHIGVFVIEVGVLFVATVVHFMFG